MMLISYWSSNLPSVSVSFLDEAPQSSANGTENNILHNEGRSYLFVEQIHWYWYILLP